MASTAILKQAAFNGLCTVAKIRSLVAPKKVVLFCLEPSMGRKFQAVASLLRKHGIPAVVSSSLARASRVELKSSRDLFIGNWNGVSEENMPKDYIFWNAEPISMDGWCDAKDWGPASEFHLRWHHSYELRSQWLGTMSKALAVWDYSITNKPHVEETGRSFTHVPFGYAQAYEDQFNESTQGLQIEQDIDVLFYGWMSPRRQRVLDELTRRGINVHVASFKNPAVNSSLDLLLARSKIVLGIHCYEETTAHLPDLARFDFLLSNRIFAIHERPSSSGLGTGLEDNVTTESYSNLADACDHFLTHPEERASLADRSYHWFKSAFSMEDYLPFEKIRALLTSR